MMNTEEVKKIYAAHAIAQVAGRLIKNGINISEVCLPFTMLDYLSFTKVKASSVASVVKGHKISLDREQTLYKNLFLSFVDKSGSFFYEVEDINDILDQHHVFIIRDYKFIPEADDIQKIFDLLDENNIPKYDRVIYTALDRLAHGYPILPLVESTKEKQKNI